MSDNNCCLSDKIMREMETRHNWYDRKIGKKPACLSEFDPVVSILIREMASVPDHLYEGGGTDRDFHMWLVTNNGCYYSSLLRLAQEIRHAIRQEVWHATARFADDHENEIYNHAIDDCLEIIESRAERPI